MEHSDYFDFVRQFVTVDLSPDVDGPARVREAVRIVSALLVPAVTVDADQDLVFDMMRQPPRTTNAPLPAETVHAYMARSPDMHGELDLEAPGVVGPFSEYLRHFSIGTGPPGADGIDTRIGHISYDFELRDRVVAERYARLRTGVAELVADLDILEDGETPESVVAGDNIWDESVNLIAPEANADWMYASVAMCTVHAVILAAIAPAFPAEFDAERAYAFYLGLVKPSSVTIKNATARLLEAYGRSGLAVVNVGTGSGKSTLLPLVMISQMPRGGTVVVTEPKISITKGVSKFVSGAFGLPRGLVVGYRNSENTVVSDDYTMLVYETEGFYVSRLRGGHHMDMDTVMIDEIHEGTVSSEILISAVKYRAARQLAENGPRTRPPADSPPGALILSATFDVRSMVRYLAEAPQGSQLPPVPAGSIVSVYRCCQDGIAVVAGEPPADDAPPEIFSSDGYVSDAVEYAHEDNLGVVGRHNFYTEHPVRYSPDRLRDLLADGGKVVVRTTNFALCERVIGDYRETATVVLEFPALERRYGDLSNPDSDRVVVLTNSPFYRAPEGFVEFAVDVMLCAVRLAAEFISAHVPGVPGDVILFVSGESEVRQVSDLLSSEEHRRYQRTSAVVYGDPTSPDYADVPPTPAEFELSIQTSRVHDPVYDEPDHPAGAVVYVATNYFESGVTPDGATVCIDTLFEKSMMYLPSKGASCLFRQPVSRFSAVQRGGRIGRTRAGCYLALCTLDALKGLPAQSPSQVSSTDLIDTVPMLIELESADVVPPDWDLYSKMSIDVLTATFLKLVDYGAVSPVDMSLTQVSSYPDVHGIRSRLLLQAAGANGCFDAMADIVAVLESGLYRDRVFRRLMVKHPDPSYLSDYLFALHGAEALVAIVDRGETVLPDATQKCYEKYRATVRGILGKYPAKSTDPQRSLRVVAAVSQIFSSEVYDHDSTLVENYVRKRGISKVSGYESVRVSENSMTWVYLGSTKTTAPTSWEDRRSSREITSLEQHSSTFVSGDKRIGTFLPDRVIAVEREMVCRGYARTYVGLNMLSTFI